MRHFPRPSDKHEGHLWGGGQVGRQRGGCCRRSAPLPPHRHPQTEWEDTPSFISSTTHQTSALWSSVLRGAASISNVLTGTAWRGRKQETPRRWEPSASLITDANRYTLHTERALKNDTTMREFSSIFKNNYYLLWFLLGLWVSSQTPRSLKSLYSIWEHGRLASWHPSIT